MRAATIRDKRIVVTEHPDPSPGRGELLVRVRAAGLNGADMMQLRGLYPAPRGAPSDIPGLEFAGEVIALGEGSERFRLGDRIMTLAAGGGQAERAIVHERAAMPVPAALEWPAAGGFPEVFTTAHDALITQCELRPGERLLVHGAAGGVGTAAVQIGVAMGARVVASVRNPEHRPAVAAMGAAVIDPSSAGESGPHDVILELVGAPNFPANLNALETGGRIVVIGIGAGPQIELDLRQLMMRRARLMASTLRARPLEEKALAARRVEAELLPLVDAGRLQVPLAATYPLETVAEAYERFQAGGKLGKIVLTIG